MNCSTCAISACAAATSPAVSNARASPARDSMACGISPSDSRSSTAARNDDSAGGQVAESDERMAQRMQGDAFLVLRAQLPRQCDARFGLAARRGVLAAMNVEQAEVGQRFAFDGGGAQLPAEGDGLLEGALRLLEIAEPGVEHAQPREADGLALAIADFPE